MGIYDDYMTLFRYINGNIYIKNIGAVTDRLKDHLIMNPTDRVSIMLKEWLFSNIKDAFLNSSLDDAFNMNENLPYTKKIEIFNNLPFVNRFSDFRYYFYKLLPYGYNSTAREFYNSCKHFCINYKDIIPVDKFDRVIDYCDNNTTIMGCAFEAFHINKNRNTSFKNRDKNEIYGLIGERYIYDTLKKTSGKPTFLEKNGFGFDVLYNDLNNKEWLIEVKATCRKLTQDTYFEMTKNERKILKNTLELPNTEYIITRVFINPENYSCSYIPLYYDKENDCFYNNETNVIYTHNEYEELRFSSNAKINALKK